MRPNPPTPHKRRKNKKRSDNIRRELDALGERGREKFLLGLTILLQSIDRIAQERKARDANPLYEGVDYDEVTLDHAIQGMEEALRTLRQEEGK